MDGREIRYTLAERSVEVLPDFRMREVRRLCDNGHQTAILTTRQDLPIAVVAYRMFERWTQENFFRYMRQHFALDALVTYAVEPADPDRTIPNPERKALRKQLTEGRTTLKALEQALGARGPDESRGPAADHARLQDRARRPRPADPRPGARVPSAPGPDRGAAGTRAGQGGAWRRPRSSRSRRRPST